MALFFPRQALIFMHLLYKSFENTVGKGEIALNEQFLHFPQCFLPIWQIVNSLPNDEILDWYTLEAFADDRIELAKMIIFVFDGVENIVGKGENAGYQHFLLFQPCF